MQDTFTPISEVGEFGLIDRLESVLGEPANPSLVMSIGDDAAVYRAGADKVSVVTSDALIEGVHFDLSFIPMEHLGAKSLMVNLSDVIAMNALPKFATVVLGIPNHVSVEMAEELYRGIRKVCEAYDVTIIGGDITGARQLTISITAIGEALEDELAYRKGAEPGDVLCVTGDLGSAYAGLKVLLRERAELQEKKEEFVPTIRQYQYVVNRNLAPVARLGVIQSWREAGFRPHAMIDVSDGLASEVNHLCRRSGCGAIVRASDIPLHDQTHRVATEFGESPTLYQLQGGEDYELLFAAPESELKKLKDSSYAVIGEFVAREEGVVLQHADGTEEELKPIGWDHFA
ncbi:MAG: thiamine-phosphate kinase [Rhodothermales bacterium]